MAESQRSGRIFVPSFEDSGLACLGGSMVNVAGDKLTPKEMCRELEIFLEKCIKILETSNFLFLQ